MYYFSSLARILHFFPLRRYFLYGYTCPCCFKVRLLKYCARRLQQGGKCCAEYSSSVLLEIQNVHVPSTWDFCINIQCFYLLKYNVLALFLENEAWDRTLVNRMNMLSCHFSLGSITFMTEHILEDVYTT